MNFEGLEEVNEEGQRSEFIDKQIFGENWIDHLGDSLDHGGWPEDLNIEQVDIEDDGTGDIIVSVQVSFIESCSTSCGDLNKEHPGSADFEVVIDRESYDYHVDMVECEIDSDFEIASGDYY